ncbi:MAG TPA: sigma 54-interacting transcriptional regulator, partial [Polyangiaceae bacterium]|nr:sigma 54-interacting transcriptional regulator [Polyangiaceae bacterium]
MKTTLRPAAMPPPPRDGSGPAQLAVYSPNGVTTYPLSDGTSYSIGRATLNDIVIAHDAVSRRHAIVHGGATPAVQDLQSSNGIRVEGRLLESGGRAALKLGSVLQIGPAVLVVQDASVAIGPGPEPTKLGQPGRHGLGSIEAGQTGVVLRDQRMLNLYQTIEAVAPGDISVLVLGETGVGKELLAHAIHSMSARSAHAFVKFNSAALPEQLVESELFGYERGAFTGADKAKAGLFETADGGTLFLDEVGDLSLAAQAKLLRVLETGDILRVGSVRPKRVSVRFISATNRDLRALIQAGSFRKDLFYRLNGVTIRVPALRNRPLDIPALVEFFAARAAGQPGGAAPEFTGAALAKLVNHAWPGNIRELRNVVERAALLTRGGLIDAEDLQLEEDRGSSGAMRVAQSSPFSVAPSSKPGSAFEDAETRVTSVDVGGELAGKLRDEMARQERARILDALNRAHGNQTVAAELLGVSRRT